MLNDYEPVQQISYPFDGGPWDGERIDLDEGYAPLGDGSFKVVRSDIVETPYRGGRYYRTRNGLAVTYVWRAEGCICGWYNGTMAEVVGCHVHGT